MRELWYLQIHIEDENGDAIVPNLDFKIDMFSDCFYGYNKIASTRKKDMVKIRDQWNVETFYIIVGQERSNSIPSLDVVSRDATNLFIRMDITDTDLTFPNRESKIVETEIVDLNGRPTVFEVTIGRKTYLIAYFVQKVIPEEGDFSYDFNMDFYKHNLLEDNE